ncbi:hypothetical protein IscW_ISCW004148 [Ixodes scapularis]|uniref:Uncharacterized protein n=1 Tax=Ixodes scapularis TaxID=6945 RepID=B7PGL5_IXOSC|nr:hypothetical protein IscW_ISCW004148 [Ixodes scapularis]|eukprot:XP_002400915.1 hypothetical protein IscW_ISCW004148 [Ixodes scapularis]
MPYERLVPPTDSALIQCSDHYVMPRLSSARDYGTATLMFLTRSKEAYTASSVLEALREVVDPSLIVQMGPFDCDHIWLVRFSLPAAREKLLSAKDVKCDGQPAFCVQPLVEHSLHRGRCVESGLADGGKTWFQADPMMVDSGELPLPTQNLLFHDGKLEVWDEY